MSKTRAGPALLELTLWAAGPDEWSHEDGRGCGAGSGLARVSSHFVEVAEGRTALFGPDGRTQKQLVTLQLAKRQTDAPFGFFSLVTQPKTGTACIRVGYSISFNLT